MKFSTFTIIVIGSYALYYAYLYFFGRKKMSKVVNSSGKFKTNYSIEELDDEIPTEVSELNVTDPEIIEFKKKEN